VWSPPSPLTNETVTFTSALTDVSLSWALDPDGVCNDGDGPSVQRSFPLAGSYWIRLCVTDGSQTWSNTRLITISNRPPVAAFTHAPAAPLTRERILLASTSSDPDGPSLSQAWDLDADGAFDDASGPTAEWSFPDAGDHSVRLQVTDRDGASAVAAAVIPVDERPVVLLTPFPVVRVTASVSARGTRILQLVVQAPDGARVQVRCRGRRCPFRSFARTTAVKVRAAGTVRIRRLARYLLRPGTSSEIRVTKRGEMGKYTRFRVRRRMPPARLDRCLQPGSRRPVRCPN
jgi:PKD domain